MGGIVEEGTSGPSIKASRTANTNATSAGSTDGPRIVVTHAAPAEETTPSSNATLTLPRKEISSQSVLTTNSGKTESRLRFKGNTSDPMAESFAQMDLTNLRDPDCAPAPSPHVLAPDAHIALDVSMTMHDLSQ